MPLKLGGKKAKKRRLLSVLAEVMSPVDTAFIGLFFVVFAAGLFIVALFSGP